MYILQSTHLPCNTCTYATHVIYATHARIGTHTLPLQHTHKQKTNIHSALLLICWCLGSTVVKTVACILYTLVLWVQLEKPPSTYVGMCCVYVVYVLRMSCCVCVAYMVCMWCCVCVARNVASMMHEQQSCLCEGDYTTPRPIPHPTPNTPFPTQPPTPQPAPPHPHTGYSSHCHFPRQLCSQGTRTVSRSCQSIPTHHKGHAGHAGPTPGAGVSHQGVCVEFECGGRVQGVCMGKAGHELCIFKVWVGLNVCAFV